LQGVAGAAGLGELQINVRGQAAAAGDGDDGEDRVFLAEGEDHFQTVGARHHDVGDDEVEPGLGQVFERGSAVFGAGDGKAGAFEGKADGGAEVAVVIDDEDVRHGGRAGWRRPAPGTTG